MVVRVPARLKPCPDEKHPHLRCNFGETFLTGTKKLPEDFALREPKCLDLDNWVSLHRICARMKKTWARLDLASAIRR